MNEQEFIRRMKIQGVKLTDQQMKSEYRRYLKDPESFGSLTKTNDADPFLDGLTGGSGTGTAKAAAKPSAGQATTKQQYMQDETIQPKAKMPTQSSSTKASTAPAAGQARIKQQYMQDETILPSTNAKPPVQNTTAMAAAPAWKKQAKTKQKYMQDDTIVPTVTAKPTVPSTQTGSTVGAREYDDFMRSFGQAMGLSQPEEVGKPAAATQPSVLKPGNVRYEDSFLTGLEIPPASVEAPSLDKGGQDGSPSVTDPTGAAAELAQLEKEWEALMKNPNATRQDFIDVFNAKKKLKSLTDAAKDKKAEIMARRLDPESRAFLDGLGALNGMDSKTLDALRKLDFSDKDGFEGALNDVLRYFDSMKYYSDPRAWGWTPEGQKVTYEPTGPQPEAAPQATMSPEQAGGADGQKLPDAQRFMGWKDKESNFDPTGVYADTLQKKIGLLKTLESTADMLERSNAPAAAVDSYRKQMETLARELDYALPGLKGDYSDPSKMVDIKFNGKAVGNSRYSGGTALGNLDDIARGVGGNVSWGGSTATIRDADGKEITTITVFDSQAIEKDKNGTIIKIYPVSNGKVQADIVDYAKRLNVPVSYYHDKNGVFHAYAQPEMRGAPVQVVRKENQIIVDAYMIVDTGDPTVVESIIKSINDVWNNPTAFDIGSGNVNIVVNVHAKDRTGKSYRGGVPGGQSYVAVNFSDPSERSHVYTADTPIEHLRGIGGALMTGELEKVKYDWRIDDPGNMWLTRPEDAAHEFLHIMGVSDAYSDFYRQYSDPPANVNGISDGGQPIKIKLLDKDLALCGDQLSAADVYLIYNAWRLNQPQYFDKKITPDKSAKVVQWMASQLGMQLTEDDVKTVGKAFEFIEKLKPSATPKQ